MPIDYREYHPDWKSIVRQINDQAGNCCEWCGIGNGEIARSGATVVLTTAHLDHDKRNNNPANLRALCQRCHLNHDREHHIAKGHETRRCRRMDAGQTALEIAP